MHPASFPLFSLSLGSIGRKIFARLTRFTENLVGLLPLLAISLALSAFIVFGLISRRTVYLLLFVLALTAAIYLVNPIISTYSNHGMAHLGFVYATGRFHWPPEDPYFAGTSLHYPWGYDALVGGVSSLLNVPPSWVYAGCNLAALAVTVVAVAGITRLLEGDEITANCAVVIAVLAPTLLGGGAEVFLGPLTRAIHPAFWGPEALPPVEKYSNINAMPLGMAVGLVGLYKLFSIVKAVKYTALDMISVAMFMIIIGHIYPHIWLSSCIIAFVCAVVALWAGEWRKALVLTAALLLGNLAVVPYLLALTGGRTPGHGIRLEPDPHLWLARLLHVAIILLPLWFLIALRRRSLIERLREPSWAHWAALGSGLALLLTFIGVNTPGDGYKFRAMAIFCLAPLAAPGVRRIYDWNKTALVLILAFQLLPFCNAWYEKTPWGWGTAAEPCYWQGTVLRHGVPEQDRLYQWIRARTPITAILIDNKPYVPVYAQRSLFVARQLHWKAEDWRRRRDGWLFHPSEWLERINGHSIDEIRHRNELVDALYSETDARSGEDLVGQLGEMTDDRPVFVIARDGQEKAALNSRPFLRRVVEVGDWAVYALEKDKPKPRAACRGTTDRSSVASL
jgi:hypothetical protein